MDLRQAFACAICTNLTKLRLNRLFWLLLRRGMRTALVFAPRRAEVPEVFPGVNTRAVSVVPFGLDGVIPDHMDVLHFVRSGGCELEDVVGRVLHAHIRVSTPAFNTWARLAQVIQWVAADPVVGTPGDFQVAFCPVQGDVCRFGFCRHLDL